MCGIAGVFGRPDPDTVERMLRRLAHRGPDDHFLVSGSRFTLGARRLAIIDVEGGRQPLSNETGTVWCCQNGEIYNFPELKEGLLDRGHRFRTRADTEVLPHLYEENGPAFPEKLRGMFGVAIWDDDRGVGVLARDHTGKKPVYYLETGKALYFASEIKALLEVPGFSKRLNASSVHHFLSYKHVPGPDTAFEGILELRPAERLTWSESSGIERRRYWRPSWSPREDWSDEDEVATALRDTLMAAVKRRLLSDVPIGFYLSGGVDSSLSTAIAATLAPGQIETFTLAYDEASTTEGKESDRSWARRVSERYGTRHHEEVIQIDDFASDFEHIVTAFDQPFSGVTASYFLSRLISRHVKVALSGDGADELFGSYLSHRIAGPIEAFASGGEENLSDSVRPLYDDNRELVTRIADPSAARWRGRLFVLSEEEKRELYTPAFSERVGTGRSEDHLTGYFEDATARDAVNRILEAEFQGFFPDQVLAFVDRLSMAHSLETRTAFLDVDFVELAASVPGEMKIRGRECKRVLKRAAEPFLPEGLVHRPKEGFVLPVNEWLLGGLSGFVDERLSQERVRRAGMMRPDRVAALIERFRAGERTLANRVLSLLALHTWWESYFPGEQAG